MSYKGSCLCGAVKFECNAEPVLMAICHCTDCQHEGGSFSDSAVFPAGTLKYTEGEPKKYNQAGASGKNVEHNFCGTCGSTLVIMQEVLVMPPMSPAFRICIVDLFREALLLLELGRSLELEIVGPTFINLQLNSGVKAGRSG